VTQYDIVKATPTSDRECIDVEFVSIFTEFVAFSIPSTTEPFNATSTPVPDRRRQDVTVQLYVVVVGAYLEAVAAEAGTCYSRMKNKLGPTHSAL
jgi:hypothetical protein